MAARGEPLRRAFQRSNAQPGHSATLGTMLSGSLQTSGLTEPGAALRREQFRRTSSRPSSAVGDQAYLRAAHLHKSFQPKSPHFATCFLSMSIASKSRHPHGNQREERAVILFRDILP